MSTILTNMGLRAWNDPNDTFSYTELVDNWAAIDTHDHTSGKGVQIPTAGIANLAIDSTKIANDAVTNPKIPLSTLTGDRLANATVADGKLSSPNNGVWRTLQSQAAFTGSMSSGTVYGFIANGALVASGVSAPQQMFLFPWTASHYAVANKTTKLRVLGTVASNTVSPGAANLTLALAPLSSNAGTAGNLSVTLAAAVAGSGSTIAAPAASNRSSFVGAEFSAPADGYYALTVSASALVNAALGFNAILQIRHV
jgi:hypothetical protein